MTASDAIYWWQRPDLAYRNGRLHLGDEDLLHLAESSSFPSFAYRGERMIEKLDSIHRVLDAAGVRHRVFYAIKANRYAPLVGYMRLRGNAGIDACSPAELLHARYLGFREEEIVYTGNSVSARDIDILAAHPGVHVNCDAISTIRRLGEACPGRTIGLRINPGASASYMSHVSYAGEKPTKFGIYADMLDEALAVAAEFDMTVDTLHFHSANGYLDAQLDTFEDILNTMGEFLERCPDVDKLDIGGGLGVPLKEGDQPLNMERWAQMLAGFTGPRNLEVLLEPGDFLVKDCGVLLVQVNTVEEKGGTRFVGVNAGFNLTNLYAYYQYPTIVVPLEEYRGDEYVEATLAGNINEGIDIFGEEMRLPPVQEGDYLAFLLMGGYCISSSSNHCMRGEFSEYLIAS